MATSSLRRWPYEIIVHHRDSTLIRAELYRDGIAIDTTTDAEVVKEWASRPDHQVRS